jgi:hypothetical protein
MSYYAIIKVRPQTQPEKNGGLHRALRVVLLMSGIRSSLIIPAHIFFCQEESPLDVAQSAFCCAAERLCDENRL